MSGFTTVVYPKLEGDAYFNLEYYISHHMPLVVEKWGPYGLKSWEVLKFSPGEDQLYHSGVVFEWDNVEAAKAAISAAESKLVFDDVPNFTNMKPILMNASIESKWVAK
ncbi:hypothetical protein BGZ63DRAFT_387621 [Mariannaea sp. PMI_226]|nr:hypothetical protein BGZ63DRAFT_387621 [Mariannaea sp. PMI_226]